MSKGRNLYEGVKSQYQNLHEVHEKSASVNFSGNSKSDNPCVFLSHKSEDKPAVTAIGEYIMERGIDVYIDINDPHLELAVKNEDHKAITAAIEIGISRSTHLLAFITTKTQDSTWVPYEIGFAKREGNGIAAMKGKDLIKLPSYLVIAEQVTGFESLNRYLKTILDTKPITSPQTYYDLVSSVKNFTKASSNNPLNNYLDLV